MSFWWLFDIGKVAQDFNYFYGKKEIGYEIKKYVYLCYFLSKTITAKEAYMVWYCNIKKNAASSIYVTLSGIRISSRYEHSAIVLTLIVVMIFGIFTKVSELHEWKVPQSIFVTLFGITIFVREQHSSKAIVLTLFGIVIAIWKRIITNYFNWIGNCDFTINALLLILIFIVIATVSTSLLKNELLFTVLTDLGILIPFKMVSPK